MQALECPKLTVRSESERKQLCCSQRWADEVIDRKPNGAGAGQQARDLLLRRDRGVWIARLRFGGAGREAKQ
jgi:hypothetical protein